MGDFIAYLIYFLYLVNGLAISSVGVGAIYIKLRRLYYTKLRWKFACLRPKPSPKKKERKNPIEEV